MAPEWLSFCGSSTSRALWPKTLSRLVRFLLVHVAHAEIGESRAPAVHVEPELAGSQPLARFLFLRDTLGAGLRHRRRRPARHDDDAVGVADDDVTWADESAGADDRDIHRAGGRLDRALRADRLRPHWKGHRGDVGDVAHARIDGQPRDAARTRGHRQ